MSTNRRTVSRRGALLVLLAAPLVWGCAGDGTGLDEFGNPLTAGVPLGPTLGSIQANIFTPICTRCHTGAAAPLGLALDAGVARQNLVDVPSVEAPALKRVDPGKPDSSYVVWKIEGRAGITGGRMPLGLPPLSAAQIQAIRGWIENGARND
ncbi:MAG: hypothetical protein ACE5HP_11640 [Gemmatimonadota bacterium]